MEQNTQQNLIQQGQQDQQKIPSKFQMNSKQQEIETKFLKENLQSSTCNSNGFKNKKTNQYQCDQEEENELNIEKNDFLLNQKFSESKLDNNCTSYSLRNKENLNLNQHINQYKGQQNETENEKNNIYNQQLEYQYKKKQSTQELKSEEKNSAKKRVLAIITLDIGNGISGVIQVIEGDDLYSLANNFCKKHKLNDDCIQYIIMNIQVQLNKRYSKNKEKLQNMNENPQQDNFNKSSSNQNIGGKSGDIKVLTESPKFPYEQQSLQGSQESKQNMNSQVLKYNGNFKQMSFNNSAFFLEENSSQQRPQQPNIGQNQFFQQNSPKKQQTMFEQIKEEDYEDYSIGLIGQSANISLPDENYEYQSTNRYQVKQQQKNQLSLSNQIFEKETIHQQIQNNIISPRQNFQHGTQSHNSTQSTVVKSQFTHNISNMHSLKSPNSLFQKSSTKNDLIGQNQSIINSNIYNYQEDQEEFLNFDEQNSRQRQQYFDKKNFNDGLKQQILKVSSEKQQLLINNKNQNKTDGSNQSQKQHQFQSNIVISNQKLQNQLSPQQKQDLLMSEKSQKQDQEDFKYDQQRIRMLQKQDYNDFDKDQTSSNSLSYNPNYNQDQKQKIIKQISDKLNIFPKSSQQPNQQVSQTCQNQNQNQTINSNVNKQSKDICNKQGKQDINKEQNLIYQYQQIDQIQQYKNNSEQNYNFENQIQNRNQFYQDSPVQVKKQKQNFIREQQFVQSERNLIKSKSNCNIQQLQTQQHEEQEEKNLDAKQSYEQWQKIINQKNVCQQKRNINRSSERSNTPTASTNLVQGKLFQILNNISKTPTHQKKCFGQTQIVSNLSTSTRVLNKNKSATQLNKSKTNQDEVYLKDTKRVYNQQEKKMKSRSVSPINSMTNKLRKETKSTSSLQIQWDEVLRSNKEQDNDENRISNFNNPKSVTNRHTNQQYAQEFEELNQVPLSLRFANSKQQSNFENERIRIPSTLNDKQSIRQKSKSKEKLNTIPTIDLSKKYVKTETSLYHSSMVNQTKINKSSKTTSINNKQNIQNESNFSKGVKPKSQINVNKSQNQVNVISKIDNSKLLNDNKLFERIANIFDKFDSDEDDQIDAINIDISTTDSDIIEIIQNALFEIDRKKLILNRNQFIDLLYSHNLIIPLKKYFTLKEEEAYVQIQNNLMRQNNSETNNYNQTYVNIKSLSTQNKNSISQKSVQFQNYVKEDSQNKVKSVCNNGQKYQSNISNLSKSQRNNNDESKQIYSNRNKKQN